MQDELFNTEAFKTPQQPADPSKTCGKCTHGIRPHYYRRDWIYCECIKSKRTQFGILKVKSRSQCRAARCLFEPRQK